MDQIYAAARQAVVAGNTVALCIVLLAWITVMPRYKKLILWLRKGSKSTNLKQADRIRAMANVAEIQGNTPLTEALSRMVRRCQQAQLTATGGLRGGGERTAA